MNNRLPSTEEDCRQKPGRTADRPRQTTRISAWVRRWQRKLSARIHAATDRRARQDGWTVTETTGRFGFTAHTYRDPRFDHRRRQLALGAGLSRTRSGTAAIPACGLGQGQADPGLAEDRVDAWNQANRYQHIGNVGE